MGGSTLGAQAIYAFLKHKIKKKFKFIDNLQNFQKRNNKENYTNLKSGLSHPINWKQKEWFIS